MQTFAQAAAQVTALWGRSYIRTANGTFRQLAIGDEVLQGDLIVGEHDALLHLTADASILVAARRAHQSAHGATHLDDQGADLMARMTTGRSAAQEWTGDGEQVSRVAEGRMDESGLPVFGTVDVGDGSAVLLGRTFDVEMRTPIAGAPAADAAPMQTITFRPAETSSAVGDPAASSVGTDGEAPAGGAAAVRVIAVEPVGGAGRDAVPEGGSMAFTVTLAEAPGAQARLPYRLGGGSATDDDLGVPVFSDGVTLGADGMLVVPAGVARFTVTVPTVQDSVVEADETVSVSLDGVSATATLVDDDVAPPTVVRIEPGAPGADGDRVGEGSPLVFTVGLSAAGASPTTLPFALAGGTADGQDIGAAIFSDGVVLNADGTVTVPAGVASFTVTVPTNQDTAVEADETVSVSIGGVSATATIVNDDVAPPSVARIEPGAPGADGDRVTEGAPLVFTVGLSAAGTAPTTLPFALAGVTADAQDIGTPTFSDGVVLNADGTVTVPAGVASFTVTVPTVQDTAVEADETVSLSIGGMSATATLVNDDIAPPTVARIEPCAPGVDGDRVAEGSPLIFTVGLSAAGTAPTTLAFTLGGGTADAQDIGTPTFSDGVVLNADGTVTVPAGVASFTVMVPTHQDSTVEADETVSLSVGGVSATATLVDDDVAPPTVARIEPGAPCADGDRVTEGAPLVFTVGLSAAGTTPTTLPFTLAGGTADAQDIGTPTFSDGVVLNPDGTVTVPAGVASFTVTVPTHQDTAVEPDETVSLSVGGVSATATLVNDDVAAPTVLRIELCEPGADGSRVTEGSPLVFTVGLSAAGTAPTTLPFALAGGTADAQDIGTPTFSDGVVLNADGTLTVPAGIASFTVTVPTVQDTAVEPDETVSVSIGGVSATATIVNDDVAPPTVARIEPGAPGADGDRVTEGAPLVFTVGLSAAGTTPTTLPFTLAGGTADAQDIGTPTFSDGVVLNPDGTVTVPAGVASFTVTVPTVHDAAVEADETVSVSVGGVSATATIANDDIAPPTVARIEPGAPGVDGDRVTEGSPLIFTVGLSAAGTTPTTLAFTLGGGTACSRCDLGRPAFSDGVTLNADGTLTVPAGVASFTVTVPTVQDTRVEGDETVPITVGGITATGIIVDDDFAPTTVTRVESSPSQASEGAPLLFTVSLSAATPIPTRLPFSLAGGTADAQDIGAPAFSDGVVLNPDGTVTVPAGVTGFTVTVPTVQDAAVEPDETVSVSIGGVSATATLVDDDVAPPTVARIEPGAPGADGDQVTEGSPLVFTVGLSAAGTTPTTLPFALAGGTADAQDLGTPTFSDGVVLNADGTVTVPAGVASFTVTVPTHQDTAVEPDESVSLSVGGISATATIANDDVAAPTVLRVELCEPGADGSRVTEGSPLVFTVGLSAAGTAPTTLPFALAGGTADAQDIGAPAFSDGVVLNADGTVTVPAGVASFTVTVPTVQDTAVEPDETVSVSIGGVSATATLVNDDLAPPTVARIEPGAPGADGDRVTEGSPLVFTVGLSAAGTAPTTLAFTLGGGTADAQDIGTPTFSDGVVLNADGTVTVPAGVANFTVTVPTHQDSTVEADETVSLSVGGVSATATLVNDDVAPPTVARIEPGAPGADGDRVAEGLPLVFTVGLSAAGASPTTLTFALAGGTADAQDIGTPTFSDGVMLNPDGTVTVPAGVASFTVTVPTVQDAAVEADETVSLSIGGVSATATIANDDVAPPTVARIEPGAPGADGDRVTEGSPLVFTVGLSAAGTAPTTLAFTLGGGTACSRCDFDRPAFSDGVVLNADGTLTVPAGVQSFTVTVPTVQDTRVEGDETVPITVGGVTATGIIVDDDFAPTTVTRVESSPSHASEGAPLLFTVSLSAATPIPTRLPIALAGGTADAHDIGGPTFSDGVVLNADGTVTVPAGVASFTITVPTHQDTAVEPDETVSVSVGGVTATATIVDDDVAPASIVSVTAVQTSGVVEGAALDFVVTTTPSSTTTPLTFDLGGSAAASGRANAVYVDLGQGWQPVEGGRIDLPPQTSQFSVQVRTLDDTTMQLAERLDLVVSSSDGSRGAASAQVLDNESVCAKVTGCEDTPLVLGWNDLRGDAAPPASAGIQVHELPADGRLQVQIDGQWQTVEAGQVIAKTTIDAGRLRFMPDADESGSDAYGRDAVGNRAGTYAELRFSYTDADGAPSATIKLEIDIEPVADPTPTLHQNVMSGHAATMMEGRSTWEVVRADGTPVAAGDPQGYKGLWHYVSLGGGSTSTDVDGSETLRYQIRINQVDVPSSPTIVGLADGTLLRPDADGSYWVDAADAERVWVFRQWGEGPNGTQWSHQSVTATVWNQELDDAGRVLSSVRGNTLTSAVNTPLVLDLDGDGVETVGAPAGVRFDFDGDGTTESTGWAGRDDGLLVLDRDGDGRITRGAELFGDAVTLADGSRARDGFAALADLDTNRDGRIDAQDADFGQLRVWVDANSDGSNQDGELRSLADAGVQSLSLQAGTDGGRYDNGNHVALVSSYTTHDGQTRELADVWFARHDDAAAAPQATGELDAATAMAAIDDTDVFGWELAAPPADGGSAWDDDGAPPPDGDFSTLDVRDILGDIAEDELTDGVLSWDQAPNGAATGSGAAGAGATVVTHASVDPYGTALLHDSLSGGSGEPDNLLDELIHRTKPEPLA